MKKMFMAVAVAGLFFTACNNNPASNAATDAVTAPEEKIDFAYLPMNNPPDNWEMGNLKNAALVLKSLKAYETGDIEGSLAPFADSVWWSFDYVDQKFSKDSLRAMFTEAWKNTASVKIVMNDYESVISKDKKDEWVTLWYKQITTDKKGKVDSISVVDDIKIENGKITVLDEKSRKFPVPKK
ncbi:MAG: hypothetical protein K2Q24_17260 [Chitinophagaceae bacterium]|jgi:hypothetical protein|nr:hypothetical protein [Chitinophagaceae bacterium]